MSLLLDALKKSEAQRRRGKAPTIDLTNTTSSGASRRPDSRWWIVLLAIALLVAVAVGLWPQVAGWDERRQSAEADSVSGADAAGARETGRSGPAEDVTPPSSTPPESSPQTTPTRATGTQRASQPAPVAGASNQRRNARPDEARPDSAPTAGEESARTEEAGTVAATRAGPTLARQPERAGEAGQVDEDGPADEAGEVEQVEQEAARGRRPSQNFIRPWELPQAQRAEFPELVLTVHFFAEQPEDRFVLINGERYAEGQQVGTGARLVEIRRRGAVVEFGSYRVLIE